MNSSPPNLVCSFCHAKVSEAAVYGCPDCGTGHHHDCFRENGGCAMPGCSASSPSADSWTPSQSAMPIPAPALHAAVGTVPGAQVSRPAGSPVAPLAPRPTGPPPGAPWSRAAAAQAWAAPPPRPGSGFSPQPATRTWSQRPLVWVLGALAVVGLLAVFGSTGSGSAPSSDPSSEVTPSGSVPEGAYGSDPQLDRLQDRCGRGDSAACDELFWESPVGSDYEAYAQRRRRGTAGATSSSADSMLESTWVRLSAGERSDLCWAYDELGWQTAQMISESSDGAVTTVQVIAFLERKC
jgi:hypothetical protein